MTTFRRSAAILSAKNLQIAIGAVVAFALVFLLTGARLSQTNQKTGDTLIFEQIVDSIAHGVGPTSEIFASTQYAIDHDVFSRKFEAYEKISDAYQPYPRNVLRFHSNYILYLLAPVSALFGAGPVLAVFQMISFAGLLLAVFWWLQKNRSGTLEALLFTVVISLHPAWGEAIWGQFYPDRGFVLLGFLFFAAVHSRWPAYVVIAIGAVTSLLNERAPLILGLFAIGHAVMFFRPSEWRYAGFKCVVGILLLLTSALLMRTLDNVYYAGGYMPHSLAELNGRLANPAFRRGLISLLEINSGLLLLSLFSWRTVPIVVGLMIPNLVGDVGGAEKTGFATHYHSYYFPALVWSAAVGFLRLQDIVESVRPKRNWDRWLPPAIALLSVLPALVLQMDNPTSPNGMAVSFDAFKARNILFRLPAEIASTYGPTAKVPHARLKAAVALVPKGAVVSSAESAMWMGEGRAREYFYPLALAQATHLGLRCSQNTAGETEWMGVISFLGAAANAEIDAAFRAKASALGFDFKAGKCIAPLGIGIVPRLKP